MFIVFVYFVIDSVRKILDIPSYTEETRSSPFDCVAETVGFPTFISNFKN